MQSTSLGIKRSSLVLKQLKDDLQQIDTGLSSICQTNEAHGARTGSVTATSNTELIAKIQQQVLDASSRMSVKNVKAVFETHADGKDGEKGIREPKFKDALTAVRPEFGLLSPEELKQHFTDVDLGSDGVLGESEFMHALQRSFPIEQSLSGLPLFRVLESAVPGFLDQDPVKHLELFSKLSDEEIDCMARAVSVEIKQLLLGVVHDLGRGLCTNHEKSAGCKPSNSGEKFSVTLSGGKIQDFHAGLSRRVGGGPDLDFDEGVRLEHCVKTGHNHRFETSNYHISTTPEREYKIVLGNQTPDLADKKHGREIPNLNDLQSLPSSVAAGLLKVEIIMMVLYTGPMFMVYNAILRRFPEALFKVFCPDSRMWPSVETFSTRGDRTPEPSLAEARGSTSVSPGTSINLFPTSIHVLQSAIAKLARSTKIPTGLKLYRGLSMAFPESFYKSDCYGCRGFAEWGFMSTTTDRAVAISYSGVKDTTKDSTVLEIRTSSVDRAACIQPYSQYEHECEYLWVPLSFLESIGGVRKESTEGAVLTVMELRVNFNGHAQTIDELIDMKKNMHLKAFTSAIEELGFRGMPTGPGITKIFERGGDLRAQDDWNKLRDGVVQECSAILKGHTKYSADEYAKDDIYRRLILDMMDAKRFALSKFELWAERGESVEFTMLTQYRRLRLCHRMVLQEQRKAFERLTAGSEEQRVAAAKMCKILGLFLNGPDEMNELGEQRLVQSAADNVGEESMQLLLAARADINAASRPGGFTAAYRAAQFGSLRCLKVLVEARADINLAEDEGATPAWIAAQNGNLKCLMLLLKEGADLSKVTHPCKDTKDLRGMFGDAPVHVAAQQGHHECLQWLLHARADMDMVNAAGRTPAIVAADNGSTRCLELLINSHADISTADIRGYTASKLATQGGHVDCLELIRGAGVELTTEACDAAYYDRMNCLEWLKGAGGDFNVKDKYGFTPVAYAAYDGNRKCLEWLLKEAHADLQAPDREGKTPLFQAAECGKLECLQLLLEAGADVKAASLDGKSAAGAAAENGHVECLQSLKEAGADINAPDSLGKTPLFHAAAKCHLKCVQLLACSRANVDNADNEGATPLIAAAHMGHLECVKCLIEAGASIAATDRGGRTASSAAAEQGHRECTQWLQDAAESGKQAAGGPP